MLDFSRIAERRRRRAHCAGEIPCSKKHFFEREASRGLSDNIKLTDPFRGPPGACDRSPPPGPKFAPGPRAALRRARTAREEEQRQQASSARHHPSDALSRSVRYRCAGETKARREQTMSRAPAVGDKIKWRAVREERERETETVIEMLSSLLRREGNEKTDRAGKTAGMARLPPEKPMPPPPAALASPRKERAPTAAQGQHSIRSPLLCRLALGRGV